MPGTRYCITIERGTLTPQALTQAHADRAKTCQSLINLIVGIDAGNWLAGRVEVASGKGQGSGGFAQQTITYSGSSGTQTVTANTPGVKASGTATITAGTGTETVTIAGRAVSVTWGTSDTATAAALAAAVNADAQAGTYVFATSAANVITITALQGGTQGNGISLTGSGTGMVIAGTVNGNLSGGTFVGRTVTFQAGTTDALTVQNAITAIRADNVMLGLVFVPTPPQFGTTINTSNILTLFANTVPVGNTYGNSMSLTATGTGASVGATTLGSNATPNGFNV